jgi:hypothetical protein
MDLRKLKTIGFSCATLADLLAVVNKYTSGQPVTLLETGTVAYGAGDVGQRVLIDQTYYVLGGATPQFTLLLFYAV